MSAIREAMHPPVGEPAADLYRTINRNALELGDFYLARSGRQQFILNRSAEFAGGGGLVYAATTGGLQAGATYIALAPLLLTEFNGNAPIRDLFYMGRAAQELISRRYSVLSNHPVAIRNMAASRWQMDDCEPALTHLQRVEAWPDAADRAAVLPAIRQLAHTCTGVRLLRWEAETLVDAFNRRAGSLALFYGQDLIELDEALNRRDSSLRQTPSSALTSTISAPLRALDSVLSQQDIQSLVNAERTRNTFRHLASPVTTITLGDAPAARIPRPEIDHAAINARVIDRSTVNRAPAAELADTVAFIRVSEPRIMADYRRYVILFQDMTALHAAASATRIGFYFDSDTQQASVRLESVADTSPPAPTGQPEEESAD